MPAPLTLILALGFALIHLFIGKLHFLDVVPRSRWLSFAGGVAVAYVFLHILPELSAHQETFVAAFDTPARFAESWVYGVALAGLAAFYGVERAVKTPHQGRTTSRVGDRARSNVFWIHSGSFAFYNVLIGYLLLHREEAGLWSLLTYFLAMALHFVTNDFGLRQDQRSEYDRISRWIFAAAVVLGWFVGATIRIPEVAIGFLFAFLAGGVVLNVLKEELPEERQSRFWPFALGVAGYGALLISTA